MATKIDSLQVLPVHLLILLEHRFCLGTLLEQNGQKQGYTIRELLVSYMATLKLDKVIFRNKGKHQ